MRVLSDHELKRARVAFGLYLGGLMKKAKIDVQSLHISARMSIEYINDILCGVMIASISAGKKIAKVLRLPAEEKLFWILIGVDYNGTLDPNEAEIVASNFPELFPDFLAAETPEEKADQNSADDISEIRRDLLSFLMNLVQKKHDGEKKFLLESAKQQSLSGFDGNTEENEMGGSFGQKLAGKYSKRALREEDCLLPSVPENGKSISKRRDSIFLGENRSFGVDFPEAEENAVIYRTRELRPGDPDLHRYVNCKAYGICLDVAVKERWSGFSCKFCPYFMDPEMNFFKDSVEVSFGGFDFSMCL